MNWQSSLVVGLLIAVLGFQQWLHGEIQKRWMRLFLMKSEMNPASTEPDFVKAEEKPAPPEDKRKRISIPLPLGAFRKPVTKTN